MEYTIKEVAEKMKLSTSTIRYYDKEGLLPNIKRKKSGYRSFSEADLALFEIIDCFKKTGMPIKDIKNFSQWIIDGDASLQKRYDLFLERKVAVETQLLELQQSLDLINFKCEYYRTAVNAGTEAIHKEEKKIKKMV